MAVLRLLSHRSCAIAILYPAVVEGVGSEICARCVLQGSSGGLGSVATARFVSGASKNFRRRQGRFTSEEGRRTRISKSTFSVRAGSLKDDWSPYETLGVPRDVDEEEIKTSYRHLVKQFHPDVYDDSTGGLEDGETPESRFIRIQAAYELLMDKDQRRQYDLDHGRNPMQASKAWMDWVLKKKKAFEQRGDMAASVWAEQQHREMSLKARRLAKHKIDPAEERALLAKVRVQSMKNFEATMNRQTLVLKKRDLMRKKDAEEAKKRLVQELLAAEGLELDDERY